MKLGTRLWLSGALLPSGVLLAALLVAGQSFRRALESSLDRGLLAQGAAESVSLFDREDGPHLHMAESPLLEEVRPFGPAAELFDEHGRLVAHFPPLPHPPQGLAPPPLEGPPSQLLTRDTEAGRQRELIVRVKNAERPFVLRLAASLGQVDESVRVFHLTALAVVAATGLVLAGLQALLGRRLARRLAFLTEHLDRVRRGDLSTQPRPDTAGDEVAALREVLAVTTTQLKRAREVHERLLADAAHELRTPLTLMRTTLDLALRRERSPEALRQALGEARDEVDRLARLAQSLLEMAAAGRGWDLCEADLCEVLDEAAEAARAEGEERGVLIAIHAVRPAVARFSATALRQAVDNLLSNALRFAPPRTTIDLSVYPHRDGWRVSVRDRGPGIPEVEREAVFAPFHRGDPRGGSGLGLAIVSEVMRQHRGQALALAPEDGPGALIVLDLPAGR
ncbi:MAG: HAMP domain-containing histidine kinase [Archangiaceae bacterium]|nr:HAMP domain-containing histidine kinase [Archangiaceae bacterium]